jgi:trehalose/maltose hydrolase-like predicted phosphorylase
VGERLEGKGGVSVTGDQSLQTAINANRYDLYASIRSDSPDAIGPSGLSSDGYAGMAFWDSDIWMFPAILATHPDIARAAVDYRFNTLQAGRARRGGEWVSGSVLSLDRRR